MTNYNTECRNDIPQELFDKYSKLLEYLQSLGSVAVAYSSGVDSTFLLYAAKTALGDRVLAITASSRSFPKRELSEAREYCIQSGVEQIICETDELQLEAFSENPKNRCYICKKELFSKMLQITRERQINELVEGSNVDDDGDYRPGHQAIAELHIKSPLRQCGFSKNEIRILSRYFQLPTWDKPSYACLASRFPYGEKITAEKLNMVDQAEQVLLNLGFRQMRVRIHGMMARIELLPEDFDKFMREDVRIKVYEELKGIGFAYVTLDIKGFRSGSMNEVLNTEI